MQKSLWRDSCLMSVVPVAWSGWYCCLTEGDVSVRTALPSDLRTSYGTET